MDPTDPPSIGELLDGETGGRLGIGAARATGAIFATWPGIVGPSVAAHAAPTSLRDGVLRVRADSPVWATEITYLGDAIRTQANEAVGRDVVHRVEVWTGPPSTAPGPHTHGPAPSSAPSAPAASDLPEGPAEARDPSTALERARRAWEARRGRPRKPYRDPSDRGK